MDDEKTVPNEVPPTKRVSMNCSDCGHPIDARSYDALVAAAEDHVAYQHPWKLRATN